MAGTLIDGWKVWKVLKPVVHFEYGLPWVRAADRGTRTKGEEETGDIDAIGFKWLSRVMYPLVLMYGVYSLYTEAHKSWWSWCIHSLANGTCRLPRPRCFTRDIDFTSSSARRVFW